jgi:hypothetical protein
MTVDSSDAIPYVSLPESQPKLLPESSQSRWVTALIQLQKHRQDLGITADGEHDDGHDDNGSHPRTWCWCKRGDIGTESVKCGNPDCTIEWYHKPCLNVYEKWFVKQYGQFFAVWNLMVSLTITELWMCCTCMIPRWKLIIAQERAARVAANDKVFHPAAGADVHHIEPHNPSVDDAGATKHGGRDFDAKAGSPDVTDATNTFAAAGEVENVSTLAGGTAAASANTSVHDVPSDAFESKPATTSATDQEGDVCMNDWSENSPPQGEVSANCDEHLVEDPNHDVLVDNMAAQAVHESRVIAEPRPARDVVGLSSTNRADSSTIPTLPTTNSRTVIDLTQDNEDQSPLDFIDFTQDGDDGELQGTSSSRGGVLRPAQQSLSIPSTRAYSAILNLPTFQAFHQSGTYAGTARPGRAVHASYTGSISLPVHNISSLQASARIWTSQGSSVRIPQHAPQGISLRYKHGETLPR